MGKKKKQKYYNIIGDPLTTAYKWLIWAAIFLVFLVPLMVKFGTFFPFISYRTLWFMGVVQVLFAVWLLLAYHDKNYRPRLNLVLIIFALFMVSISLSALFGADPAVSFWSKHERMTGILLHLHLFAFFLVLMSFLKTEDDWKKVFSIAVGIAVLVSVWGMADNYNLDLLLQLYNLFGIVSLRVAQYSQGGSTLGNSSFMGSYLLINAFLALYLLFKAKGSLRIIYGLALLLIALGLALNPWGRAMQGAFVIGLVIFFMLWLAFYYHNELVRLGARTGLGLGLAAALYIGFSAFQEGSLVRERIFNLQGMPGRFANWEAVWEGIKARPLLGWGPENFDVVLQKNFDPRVMLTVEPYVGEPWHDRAHNVVFDYLAATGMLGTLLFFGLFAVALFFLWKAYLKENRLEFWAPGAFTALIAAHFIQNLTVFDMLSSYMLLFVLLAFSALWAVGADQSEDRAKKNKEGKKARDLDRSREERLFKYSSLALALALAVIVSLSFNYFVYKPYRGGTYTNQALAGPPGVPLMEEYARAIETSPLGRQQIRRHLAEKAISRLQQSSGEGHNEIYYEEIEFMIDEVIKSTEESPLNFRRFYTLGQLYNAYTYHLGFISDQEETQERAQDYSVKAENTYRKAIELSPTNVQAYWGLAQALINQGFLFSDQERFESAHALILQAVEIEPRFFHSHEMGVRIAAEFLGDHQLAMESIERAIKVEPLWEEPLKLLIDNNNLR